MIPAVIVEGLEALLALVPVEKVEELIGDLVTGRTAKAAANAEIIAETVAIKAAARAPYEAEQGSGRGGVKP